MISKWTLKNFKSVSRELDLEFAPLTIFAGANSAGKSTILQSILLTAQTMQNSVTDKSIILNGHISRFGAFDDVLSNEHKGNDIEIGFTMQPKIDIDNHIIFRHGPDLGFTSLECKFSFTGKSINLNDELLQLQPKLQKCYVKINKDNSFDEIEITRSAKTIEERKKEFKLRDGVSSSLVSLEFEVIKPTRYKDAGIGFYGRIRPRNAKYGGAILNHFIPKYLAVVYDRIEEEKRVFIDFLLKESFGHFETKDIFDRYINDEIKLYIVSLSLELIDERKEAESKYNLQRFHDFAERLRKDFTEENFSRVRRYPIYGNLLISKIEEHKNIISQLIKTELKEDYQLDYLYNYEPWTEYIDSYFKKNLKYLGPLRDEPKPVYPLLGTSDPKDIGFKGENTASVLDLNRNAKISYIPSSLFENKSPNKQPINSTLLAAVLDWLMYMGVANEISTLDKGKLGHEMKILSPESNELHDLTQVGVGVSQLLPILVLSLLSDSDSTLIFEQPELHLHPKVQTRLADFFVSMTLLNKQCLVETHSEYLINRLRYQVAIAEGREIADNSLIYFVEKENNTSIYRKISINKYGVIEDWPKGFFDENEQNAAEMLKAAMEKRKKDNQ